MANNDLFVVLSERAIVVGGRVLVALIVLTIGWMIAGWLSRLTRGALTRAKIDATLAGFLATLVRWSAMLLVILTCLSIFGVETTSFAAVIGSAGIAIGLAFQGTLSNFAAGIMLLLFRPFKVGDVINIAGQLGKVYAIELFTTALDSFDNRRFIIPNSQIFGATIENLTHHAVRRADVDVGVAYAADIDHTREVLTQAAASVPGGLADPAPQIFLLELAGSSVNWSVRVWAKSDEFGDVRQATIRAVKMALDQAGIEIPFPQMDVHLRKQE
ncbi:MAG: mechanosensitive ion channel family protein [Pirellulales bacterium]